MKNIYLFISFISLLCFACQKKDKIHIELGDYIYQPEYASGFNLQSIENSLNSLISIFNPWQDAKDYTFNLLVSRDSTDYYSFDGQVLKGTAQRIVCMSSTHIAMLEALGAIDKVVGVSGKQYISNPVIRNSDAIPDVGYEGNMDYETLLSLHPDLVLLFAVNGVSALEPKLKEFGIPFLYVGDYVEESPLGKAEWIVPLAEVIGKRKEGEAIFEKISQKYGHLKSMIANNELERPNVMVNAPFSDSWIMPSKDSYVACLIEDAGGNYILSSQSESNSIPIDQEEALRLLSFSDFWINVSTFQTLKELKESVPKFTSLNIFNSGNIYNNNLKATYGGGNDYYESGVVHPDLVLRDLIKIFHPELIKEEFTYYHRLE